MSRKLLQPCVVSSCNLNIPIDLIFRLNGKDATTSFV